LDFVLRSSENEQVAGNHQGYNRRTCGYKRRKEAITKATEQAEPLVKRILATGIDATITSRIVGFPSPLFSNNKKLLK
jgi:hypothetical protein